MHFPGFIKDEVFVFHYLCCAGVFRRLVAWMPVEKRLVSFRLYALANFSLHFANKIPFVYSSYLIH
jgi:hypothetical protein